VILNDRHIKRLCLDQRMVEPFDEALLNPASLDLRLGDEIMVEQPESPEMLRVSIANCTAKHPYRLAPKQFVLAATQEVFRLPNDICGVFVLKSSRAREGYEHAHAGFAEPSWTGSRLTLELSNNRQLHPLPLYPGLLIGHMVFPLMTEVPDLNYAEIGHYNNQPQVMPSWLGPIAA